MLLWATQITWCATFGPRAFEFDTCAIDDLYTDVHGLLVLHVLYWEHMKSSASL